MNEMKKILTLMIASMAMLVMSGNGVLDIVPTVHAQEVHLSRSAEDVTITGDSCVLVYINFAENQPRIDSVYYVRPRPIPAIVDTLEEEVEKPAEEIVTTANVVPNKPFERVIVKWAARNRYGKYTSQCAAHANGCLTRAGYYSQGHAYQILARFPSVINGYKSVKIPDLSKISSDKRFSAVLNMHRQAADYVKENLDISKLVPGAYYVVNMYYATSPYMLQFFYSARSQGTGTYGTHVGVLYYKADAQAWVVEHNIHGSVYYDALVSILGGYSNPNKYGITAISRVSR